MTPRRLLLDLRDQRPVWGLPPWVPGEIRDALPEGWELVVAEGGTSGAGDGVAAVSEEVRAGAREAEIYVGFGVPAEVLEAGAGLRWVHSAAAGVGSSLGSLMRRRIRDGLLFTNSAGIHGPPIAESVVAGILYFARGLDLALRGMREREWDPEPFLAADTPVGEVAGRTVGVFGFGGIGREVARRVAALGMRVVAAKRRAPGDGEERLELPGGGGVRVEIVHGPGALEALLPRSEYLVLTAPETDETRGIVDGAALSRLPEGAVLSNVSRGTLVETEALARALRGGRLRGAHLDVTDPEPLPPESPLRECGNVLITPHVSAVTRRFWERECALITENLRRYVEGRPLRNAVDPERGY